MTSRWRRFTGDGQGATSPPPKAPVRKDTPFMPMGIQNGFLTDAPNRHAPTTDINHAVRDFRRYVDVGFEHVILNNGLRGKIATGLFSPAMLSQANYLSTVVPIIPGQRRDNFGGFQPKGIDPLSYAALVQNGPGSQPSNPGGPGKIAGQYYVNPYAGGG